MFRGRRSSLFVTDRKVGTCLFAVCLLRCLMSSWFFARHSSSSFFACCSLSSLVSSSLTALTSAALRATLRLSLRVRGVRRMCDEEASRTRTARTGYAHGFFGGEFLVGLLISLLLLLLRQDRGFLDGGLLLLLLRLVGPRTNVEIRAESLAQQLETCIG